MKQKYSYTILNNSLLTENLIKIENKVNRLFESDSNDFSQYLEVIKQAELTGDIKLDENFNGILNKGYKEGINEGATKDPAGLEAELEEIEDLYNEFGPEGFYKVKFSNFLKEFPLFGKEVILAFIKEMEIRSPEEMEDEETLEADWATGELIIKEDWPCILDGAHRMVNGRGKNNKHNVQWEKIWKNYYKSYDESFNK